MLTAKDIQFHTLDRDKVSVTFQVENLKAVQEFMDNKALQEFLTSDYDFDSTKRGCRLIVTLNTNKNENGKETLVIRRSLGERTMPKLAAYDLMHSLVTFIFPPTNYNYNDLADITAGLTDGNVDVEKAYAVGVDKTKEWERAKPFVLESKLKWDSKNDASSEKPDDQKAAVETEDAVKGSKSKIRV